MKCKQKNMDNENFAFETKKYNPMEGHHNYIAGIILPDLFPDCSNKGDAENTFNDALTEL